jgi:tRNA(fMet)-specific endonuclease VapC
MAKKLIKKVILDTNIIIQLLRENPSVENEIDRLGFDSIWISSISELEILFGMFKSEEKATKRLLRYFNKIYLDKDICKKANELMIEYRGRRPRLADCLIAATCLTYDYQLFTLNRKDFDYLGVKLYNPLIAIEV